MGWTQASRRVIDDGRVIVEETASPEQALEVMEELAVEHGLFEDGETYDVISIDDLPELDEALAAGDLTILIPPVGA